MMTRTECSQTLQSLTGHCPISQQPHPLSPFLGRFRSAEPQSTVGICAHLCPGTVDALHDSIASASRARAQVTHPNGGQLTRTAVSVNPIRPGRYPVTFA